MTQKIEYINGQINGMIRIIQKNNNWHQHRYYGHCAWELFGPLCQGNGLDTAFHGVMNCYFKNGNRVKAVVYDNTGKVIKKWEYEYDGNNNVVKRIYFNYEKETPNISKTLYAYSDSLLIKEKYCNYNEDTVSGYWKYQYDSFGNLIKDLASPWSWIDLILNKYDVFNRITYKIYYDWRAQMEKTISIFNYKNKILTNRIDSIYEISETEYNMRDKVNFINQDIDVEEWFNISQKNTQIQFFCRSKEYYYNNKGLLTRTIENDQTNEPIKMTKYVYEFYN